MGSALLGGACGEEKANQPTGGGGAGGGVSAPKRIERPASTGILVCVIVEADAESSFGEGEAPPCAVLSLNHQE